MPPKGKKSPRAKPYKKSQRKSGKNSNVDTSLDSPLQDVLLPPSVGNESGAIMESEVVVQPSTSQMSQPITSQPAVQSIPIQTQGNQADLVNPNSQPVSRIEFLTLQRSMADMTSKFMAFINAQPIMATGTSTSMQSVPMGPVPVITSQPAPMSQMPQVQMPQVQMNQSRPITVDPAISADRVVQSAVNNHLASIVNPGECHLKEKVSYQVDRRIPDKILEMIWEDQYVDLTSMLPKEVDSDTPLQLIHGKPGEPATWAPVKVNKEISNIGQWCELFDIYVAAYSRKRPDQTPNLLTHKFNVSALAADGADYLYYDVEFRKAHAKYGIPWENPDMQIWVKAASKGIQTSLAMAMGSNTQSNINTTTSNNNTSYNNNKSNNQSFRPNKGSNTGAGNKLRHPAGYCFLFHNKRCGKNNCRFLHQCWMPGCGEKHSVYRCPKLHTQQNKFPKNNSNSSGAKQSQSANPNKS